MVNETDPDLIGEPLDSSIGSELSNPQFNPLPNIISGSNTSGFNNDIIGGFDSNTVGGFSSDNVGGFLQDTIQRKSANHRGLIEAKQNQLIDNLLIKRMQLGGQPTEQEREVIDAYEAIQDFKAQLNQRELNKETALVSDDSIYTPLGKLANIGVAVKTGIGDVARTIVTAPARVSRINLERGITPEQFSLYSSAKEKNDLRAAYDEQLESLIASPPSEERDLAITDITNKLQNQRLTPEEETLFQPETNLATKYAQNGRTIADRIAQAEQLNEFLDVVEEQAKESTADINTAISAPANRKLKKATDRAATHFKNDEYLEGTSEFLKGLKNLAVEDTYAASQVLAQSLPYMVGMVTSGIALVPAETVKLQDAAIESFKQEYGELPTQSERQLIGLLSGVGAGLDKISAGVTKNAATISKSIFSSLKPLNQRLPKSLVKGLSVVGAPVGATILEGATEGTQNVLQQVSETLRDPVIDVSEALVDTAHGAIGGAAFSAPNVASEAVSTIDKARPAVGKALTAASNKIQDTLTNIETKAVEKTDSFIEDNKTNNPVAVIEKVINDGFDGLDSNKRVERLKEIINLNDELRNSKSPEFNEIVSKNDETITRLTNLHFDLQLKEDTGSNLQEHIEQVDTSEESIIEVSNAVKAGTDLPLKTLNRVSGSILFKKIDKDIQEVITQEIQYKKNINEVSNEIQFGDSEEGTRGIVNYLEDIKKAKLANNTKLGTQIIDDLTNWRNNQNAKLDAFNAAKKEFSLSRSKEPVEFEFGDETKTYHPIRSKKLLQNINKDLRAINLTLDKVKDIFNATTNQETKKPLETTESKTGVVSKGLREEPKKKMTVLEKIEQPLTNDSSLGKEKIKALETLEKRSGKLPDKLVTKLDKLKTNLNNVESLTESQLLRLNNTLKLAYTTVRTINKGPKSNLKKSESVKETPQPSLTKNLLMDDTSHKSIFIKTGKNDSKLGTPKGFKAKDVFKPKKVEKRGLLNVVPNFFNRFDNEGFSEAFSDAIGLAIGNITANDLNILNSLTKFNKAFSNNIKSKISFLDKSNPLFGEYTRNGEQILSVLDQSPLGYLVKEDEKGNRFLDENVIGLMTTVFYNWLGTRGTRTLLNLDPDINSILSRDSDDNVSIAERDALAYAGSTMTIIAESLGNQVVKQLGLEVTPEVDGNLLDRLAGSIGLTILASGIDKGYLEPKKVDLNKFIKLKENKVPNRETTFIKVVNTPNDKLKPIQQIDLIGRTIKLNPKFIDRVFGIDSNQKFASIEPVTVIPKFLKGTRQKIPYKLKKSIEWKQKIKWNIKKDMHVVANNISRESLNRLSGIETDLSKKHITERESIAAVNEDIKRNLDNYFESIDQLDDINKPIYFEHESFKNMRTAIATNMLNPGANKLHRHLVNAASWEVVVPAKSEKLGNNLRTNFQLAVAQSFGFKIETNTIEASKKAFDDIITNPIVERGIKAVRLLVQSGKSSSNIEEDIEAAVKLGGEKLHSLDGLLALSNYDPVESFSSSLGIEVDGVTNGIAIGLMQAPLESNIGSLLESVGIYLNGNEGINYPDWASNPVNQDLYKKLTSNWVQTLNNYIAGSPILTEQVTNITELIGTFVDSELIEDEVISVVNKLGRDVAKSPMMLTGYGSAIKNSVNKLTPDFVKKIHDKLALAGQKETKEEVIKETKAIINSVNTIVGSNEFKNIDYSAPTEIVLPDSVIFSLQNIIESTYGESLKEALEKSFPRFFEFRNTVNKMLNTSFEVFNIKYEKELQLKSKELGNKVLSNEQKLEVFNSIKEYQPLIKSALSNGLDDSLIVLDENQTRQYGNKQHRVQVNTGPIKGLNTKSLSMTVSEPTYSAPGARGLVYYTQSLDASIQALSSFYHDFLDIYDAKIVSIKDVNNSTENTNKALWDIVTTYSVIDSVHETFKRTMLLAKDDKDMRKAALTEINKFKGPKDKITVNQFNSEVVNLKKQIDSVKKTIKSLPNVAVNQYALSNGVYTANVLKDKDETIEESTSKLVDELAEEIKKLEDDQSGSSILPIDFDNFKSYFDETLSADNSLDIFDSLESFGNKKESVEHKQHLKEVLTNIVNKVLRATDSIELKVGDTPEVSHGAAYGEKVYINASTSNRLNNNNEMSIQEIQVHELLHTTLNYAIDNNFHAKKELIRLFKQVKKSIESQFTNPWHIFMNTDAKGNILVQNNLKEETKAAKDRYDYIFNNSSVHDVPTVDPLTGKLTDNPTNDYLKEFVAFGLTNEKFIDILSKIDSTAKRDISNLTLKDKLINWLNSVLDWVSGRLYRTSNLKSDKALRNLVDHLAGVTSKQRNVAITLLTQGRDINSKVRYKLYRNIIEPIINNRINPTTRLKAVVSKYTSPIALIPIAYHNSQLRKDIREVLRRIGITEENVALKLVREIQGTKANNILWHTLLRQSKHLVDSARKAVSVDIQRYVRDAFQGKLPDENESKAITRVMYKSDMSVLNDKYSMNDLINILKNESRLDKEIELTKTELDPFTGLSTYYINQARGLGNWMALGEDHHVMQGLNAHVIANLTLANAGNNTVRNIPENTIEAEEIIDRLATLYSLKRMSITNKDLVANVMKRENKINNQDNGIISLLQLQKHFKEESLDKLFKGNKIQTIKGYTHETFNPRTDIKVADISEGKELAESGYVATGDILDNDPQDTNQTARKLYVLKNSAGNVYQKSTVSLTSKTARGSTLLDGYLSIGSQSPYKRSIQAKKDYIDTVTNKKSYLTKNQFTKSDLRNSNKRTLIPILNEQGRIAEFRYTMTEHSKITLLERDDRFDTVMGNMFGSVKDKMNSKQVNRRVVELAYEDYQKGFVSDPNAYVTISANTNEERYKEIFNLVPEDMKRDMEDVWGKREIIIRRELADLIFGYRKWSIGHIFEKSTKKDLQRIHKALNSNMVRHAEAVWQEVVSLAKTNIVIRTPAVLIANFISNGILSLVKGVPIAYMIKNQALAIRSLNSYQQDIKERNQLQLKLDSSKNLTKREIKKLKSGIAALNDNLTTNPVKPLIDEGVFQAITEDLEDNKSPYDFRDRLIKNTKLDKIVNSENDLVRNAVQQSFMTEETSIFKLLMKATQYSDFIARFALHKYNTEERIIEDESGKKTKGMDKDESLRDVIETFINYDIPTSKALQYMNDMGFFMFSKFLFRIQKVVFTLLKDRPVSLGLSLLVQQIMGDVPDIVDSLGLHLDGRTGFILGPLDTATDISGLKQVGEVVGY